MICSSQLVPPARAVRADFFGRFILKSKFLSAYFICFRKYQNASVRDNIYNAHVGFRE